MASKHVDPKTALGTQRAALRQGARGKSRIGEDAGSAAGRQAERARVRRLQEAQRARQHAAHAQEPLGKLLGELVVDAARLAKTVSTLPLRLVAALRGERREAAR